MKKIVLSFAVLFSIINCGGSDDDPTPPITETKNPVPAVLVFPEKDAECTQGVDITEMNSTILFEWNTSAYTDSYEVVLKNLETDIVTKYPVSTNQINIELFRGTPYSWYVVSKSNSVSNTASSVVWKFYNAGEPTVSHAPFPAEAVAPGKGSNVTSTNGKISLDWNSSDIDNDIKAYDIYFGENSNPSIMKSNHTESSQIDVEVISTTTYYWYIITKDNLGNSSKSETFTFSVN